MQRAQQRAVRWRLRRPPSGPQSGSHAAHAAASPPTILGRRVFPGSVLTLAVLDAPSQRRQCCSAGSHAPIPSLVCPATRPSLREPARARLGVREPRWGRQVPSAALLRACVTPAKQSLTASWKAVIHSSSLMRAHAPDLLPSNPLRLRFARMVFAACCQPLLETGPSRPCLCRSFPTCLDLYSGCSLGVHAPVASLETLAFSESRAGRRIAVTRQPEVPRAKLTALVASLPPCTNGMEACTGRTAGQCTVAQQLI